MGVAGRTQSRCRIPKLCLEPAFLQYRERVSFGKQLRRAYAYFPREQVKVFFFDDLKREPAAVYADVLRFLDLAPDGRTDFPVVNTNKRHRSEWLPIIVRGLPLSVIKTVLTVKRLLGPERMSLARQFNNITRVEVSRPPLPENMRREILAAVRSDIELLENLTGRDLSSWKEGRCVAERDEEGVSLPLALARESGPRAPTF